MPEIDDRPASHEIAPRSQFEIDRPRTEVFAARAEVPIWDRLSSPAKRFSLVAAGLLGAGALIVAGSAIAEYQRMAEPEIVAALDAVSAAQLADAQMQASVYNLSLAGFTTELSGFADPATSAQLFDARNRLSLTIQHGGDVDDIAAARAEVAGLVRSVAEATVAAHEVAPGSAPLAEGLADEATTAAIAAVRDAITTDGDVLHALIDLKAAVDAAKESVGVAAL